MFLLLIETNYKSSQGHLSLILSMTTTINYVFGAGVLSPSTGIMLNNEMDDFSTPAKNTADKLPPAPASFIEPNKRPLSSMTPIIILKVNF
ncbi:hypothetical protein GIB67_011542 [Kingdonia uniflora]|uniref:Uncharacterized protein n=1 Tax=Kingdonia uniflora TaxID=39325 RepID=A0A7J7NLT2_9MAGN|nr:hypothetical protein GIB67_011542 [Kingdonia uniflora]